MKKLIMSLVVVAVLLLLVAPGLAAPVSEDCAVTFNVPAVFEITVLPEVSIELSKTGFGGSQNIDPNVGIINDGPVEISMTADVTDLGGNHLNFNLSGASAIADTDGLTTQLVAGVLSGLPLRVLITESTPLPGGLDVVSTVTISMTDV